MPMSDHDRAVIHLYRNMPGAPLPPKDFGGYMWGEVAGNDHWEFCAAIVDTVIRISKARD
jgi:hypothetical protein